MNVWILFAQTLLPYYLMTVFLLFAFEFLQVRRSWRIVTWFPVLLSTLYVALDMFFLHHYDDAALTELYNNPPWGYHVIFKGNPILFIVATTWVIRALSVYANDIKEHFSFTEPIQLNWLRHFSWIYVVIVAISLVTFTSVNFGLLDINTEAAYTVVSVSTVLAIFYLSFHGIRHYSIAAYYGKLPTALNNEVVSPSMVLDETKEKYKTSSLSKAAMDKIYSDLVVLFEQRKLYCEPKLQLSDVGDALKITTHDLSQTINAVAEMPFYDFVNGYRVLHLRGLLENPANKKFTILALGLDSGFNSKASLNRVFKEATGLSPSEYQKRNLRA